MASGAARLVRLEGFGYRHGRWRSPARMPGGPFIRGALPCSTRSANIFSTRRHSFRLSTVRCFISLLGLGEPSTPSFSQLGQWIFSDSGSIPCSKYVDCPVKLCLNHPDAGARPVFVSGFSYGLRLQPILHARGVRCSPSARCRVSTVAERREFVVLPTGGMKNKPLPKVKNWFVGCQRLFFSLIDG